MSIKYLSSLSDLKDKKVLLRVDLNVPLEDGKISDDFRITKILPTLKFLKEAGAKTIILAHLEDKIEKSLKIVCEELNKYEKVSFIDDMFSDKTDESMSNLKSGDFVLFENLRKWPGEKKNDENFAKKMASFGDIYVNDAFSASHREHASIVGIPKFLPSYAGLLFEKEIYNLSLTFDIKKRPFVFILAGAKFETKLPLVEKFLPVADKIFVLGALANDVYKAKGFEVGTSLVSLGMNFSKIINSNKLVLPIDVVVENSQKNKVEKFVSEVKKDEEMIDVGGGTMKMLKLEIEKSQFVLWNGPLGKFTSGMKDSTAKLGQIIVNSGAFSIVGGGDTVSALNKEDLNKFSFVSTGGGAMLDYLTKETLPGIEALK
ncbi:MAG: phosphoglycerate kinase [Chitinophagaceae bacterium]|nr:phosphoglycerate kinase [Chitinophagaceae bacterium]